MCIHVQSVTCVSAAPEDTTKEADENERLQEFERAGVEKYLYSKRCDEEKGKIDKKADSMLHGLVLSNFTELL